MMLREDGWLELAEVVPMTLDSDRTNDNSNNNNNNNKCILFPEASAEEETAIHVFCSQDDNEEDIPIPLTSIIVQTPSVPPQSNRGEDKEDDDNEDSDVCHLQEPQPSWLLRFHPVMFFFLQHASCTTNYKSSKKTNENESRNKSKNNTRVKISPLPMLEFQMFLQTAQQQLHQNKQNCSWNFHPVTIEKLRKGSRISVSCVYVENDDPWLDSTRASEEEKNKRSPGSKPRHMSGEQAIAIALGGRIVNLGSVLLLSTIYGYVIVTVTDIGMHSGDVRENSVSDGNETTRIVYRLSDDVLADHDYHIQGPPTLHDENSRNYLQPDGESLIAWEDDVPGYESLLKEIMDVFGVQGDPAAASGVVLTGCSGVGKSRLASCLAYHFSKSGTFRQHNQQTQHQTSESKTAKSSSNMSSLKYQNHIYYSSVQDLTFQASIETNLLENVLVPKLRGRKLWIVDDLHLLESVEGNGDEAKNDSETMMVQNAIVEAIDRFHESCCILGLAHSVSNLPSELTKSGRLEKALQILQPTQLQRIEIWKRILADENNGGLLLNNPSEKNNDWIVALASSTAGCVPRDIMRIYQDAITKLRARQRECEDGLETTPVLEWEDLREAIKSVIPSQLAELDVIKPTVFDEMLSWKEIHLQSWQDFAGYPSLKKSVYRQVVVPWRYFLQSLDESLTGDIKENKKSWLEPPPGVLFHGKSGTGKTVAAKCLAATLGLPIIQVRATDLLDKWLGGSESLLRSLFKRARAVSPCVLFLDEIDAIACNREEDDNNDVSSRILSTLLNEMDGVSSAIQKSRVLVIACTNRIGSMDSALLRPGRLQEHFHMEIPNASDLEEILKLRTGKIPLAQGLNLKDLAMALLETGATGADVGGLCREATFIAMRRVEFREDISVAVTREDFESAICERFGIL